MRQPMPLAKAEALGRAHGEDLARNLLTEVPEITSETFGETLSETEDTFRQHSPFEFYAADINAREDLYEGGSDDGWDRYNRGFERGVRVALRALGRRDLL